MDRHIRNRLPFRAAVYVATAFGLLLVSTFLYSFYALHAHLSHHDPVIPSEFESRTRLYSESQLAIVVLSAQASFDRRNVIRSTWGDRHRRKVRFVVGRPPECTDGNESDDECVRASSLLEKERSEFGDLLIMPEPDRYSALPEKLLFAYQRIKADWIAKVDDDMYVRIDALERVLRKYNSDQPMLLGNLKAHTPVSRSGKWAEQREHYDKPFYPPWPLGSAGHVISRAAVAAIISSEKSLRRYQGEDVSLGIWLDQLLRHNITYIHARGLFTNDFRNGAACLPSTDYVIIGHNLTAKDLRSCYESDRKSPLGVKDDLWVDEPMDFESPKWNRVGNFIGAGSRGGGAAAFGMEAALEQQDRISREIPKQ